MRCSKWGVNPDVIAHTALISACEKAGMPDKALEILDEIKQRGIEPNEIAHSALISACEKGQDGR